MNGSRWVLPINKVKLENKHTAEFNFDEDISGVHDQAYQDEIVARIIGEE